jgi:hypothetical protein
MPEEHHVAASDARNTTTGATSAGSIQGTPTGVFVLRIFRASSSSADDPVGDLPAFETSEFC